MSDREVDLSRALNAANRACREANAKVESLQAELERQKVAVDHFSAETFKGDEENKALQSRLHNVTAGMAIEHEKFLKANERATSAESRLAAYLEITRRATLRADAIKIHLRACYVAIDPFVDQRHLDEGTPERAYWHHGYLMALRDTLLQRCHDQLCVLPSGHQGKHSDAVVEKRVSHYRLH